MDSNMKYVVNDEIQKFLDEITHNDIEVIKSGWGDNDTILKIGDEEQRGRILDWEDIPNTLYHVTIYKNEILSTGYLKAQRMGKGFGGGRIAGISVTSNIDIAEQYYWGMLFALKLANATSPKHVLEISDWWFSKQENRIGKDLSHLKERFRNDFLWTDRPNFNERAEGSRRASLIGSSVDERIKDPIIFDATNNLKGISEDNMAIFIIYKKNIPEETPVITGTDSSHINEFIELRILNDVPYNKYYTPRVY